jgi:glucan phosphoethanolaminetransferase (alkaline phosphatase superfamily)
LSVFVATTNYGVAERVLEFWTRGEWFALTVFTGIWIVSLAALAISAFLSKLWMRIVWSLPILLSTLAGNLAYAVAKAQLSFYDVLLYWSETAHWSDIAELYSNWFALPVAKVLVGALAILLPAGGWLPAARWLFAVPTVPVLIVSALLIAEGGKGTKSLPEQFNTLAMVGVLAAKDPFAELGTHREPSAVSRSRPAITRHVILVVDESVRADFLDLNKVQGTTPFLLSQADRFANFGYAVAGNNCSLFSNLILRFGGVPSQLSESLRTGPSVWSYAQSAGYRTVYVDGQKSDGQLQNGMTAVERTEIEEFLQPSHVPELERDFFIARRLREIVTSDQPHFIYVNKRGSHFPYPKNYPHGEARFRPDMGRGEPSGRSRELLVNSYRNSLRWNVDGFFKELLSDDLANTVLIYTSDHGQNLMDQGVVLQCNSSDPHVFEALVPLLVTSGDSELRRRFEEAALINKDRTTHFEIFPTLLELFGFDPAEIRVRYGAGLLQSLPEGSRAFTYGPIVGWSGRKPHWKTMPANLRDLTENSRPIAD